MTHFRGFILHSNSFEVKLHCIEFERDPCVTLFDSVSNAC